MADLPMVRLQLVTPFIERLSREGAPLQFVLDRFDITTEDIQNTDNFVPAKLMYELVEALGNRSSDPHFAVHLGESLDFADWKVLAAAPEQPCTLHEALLLFAQDARESASSVEYSINTRPNRTTFFARRRSNFGLTLKHNDAFTLGYLLKLIRSIIGDSWKGEQVIIKMCDPAALPQGYLGCTQVQTDLLGIQIDFPSTWLLSAKMKELSHRHSEPMKTLPILRKIIASHLNETDLNTMRLAEYLGVSESTLKRRLRLLGTTFGKELKHLRKERAIQLLRETDLSISDIASEVGCSDASAFSRSFRSWTGFTPSSVRKGR